MTLMCHAVLVHRGRNLCERMGTSTVLIHKRDVIPAMTERDILVVRQAIAIGLMAGTAVVTNVASDAIQGQCAHHWWRENVASKGRRVIAAQRLHNIRSGRTVIITTVRLRPDVIGQGSMVEKIDEA